MCGQTTLHKLNLHANGLILVKVWWLDHSDRKENIYEK